MQSAVVRPSLTNDAASRVTPTTICIVDPQSRSELNSTSGLRIERVASAEQALRLARTQRIDLWVINTELPGLSGVELCSMLKARNSRAAVCLVASEYAIETERRAWAAKASMFVCKSESTDWLERLCGQFERTGSRT